MSTAPFTAPPTTPPMYQFVVTATNGLDLAAAHHEVQAAYLVEEGRYTLFKDRRHAIVAAFRTDYVVHVRRDEEDTE